MKQLVPTGLDEFLAEHKVGDVVTGRVFAVSEDGAQVEFGDGVCGTCPPVSGSIAASSRKGGGPAGNVADLSLHADGPLERRGSLQPPRRLNPSRWDRFGSFRITKLDPGR